MGFLSQSGHLILKEQTVPGTYQATTGTTGVALRLRGGSLTANRELLIPDPEIGGNRDIADAYLGGASYSGDLDVYFRMKHLATMLKGVLGTAGAPATTTGVTTHTLTPGDVLPWYSVEEKIANAFEAFQYTDVKMNTLHMEAEANGFLMGTVGLIGRLQTAGVVASNPTTLFDNSPMVVGTNITVTYNGVQLPAKSFSIDINNNLEDDDFRLGSFFLGEVTEKQREITMGVTVRPANSNLWRQAVNGTTAATVAGGLTTKQATVITMTTYEDIPGGTPLTKYSCTLTIPSSIIAPFEVTPSGDDVIEHDFEIRALRPDPAVPILTAVVKTNQATII